DAQHPLALGGELRREHAPLVVPLLPPRVGEVDVDRLQHVRGDAVAQEQAGVRLDQPHVAQLPLCQPRRPAQLVLAPPPHAPAAVTRNRPLPKPPSASTGRSLPNTARRSSGAGGSGGSSRYGASSSGGRRSGLRTLRPPRHRPSCPPAAVRARR